MFNFKQLIVDSGTIVQCSVYTGTSSDYDNETYSTITIHTIFTVNLNSTCSWLYDLAAMAETEGQTPKDIVDLARTHQTQPVFG